MVSPFKCFCLPYFSYEIPNFSRKFALKNFIFVRRICPNFMPKSAGQPADDNFKFNENGRKLSKRVENAVGKREIARYGQFLLFPQCFQKACIPESSKGFIVWEWVNYPVNLSHPHGHIYTLDTQTSFILAICL